MTQEISKKKGWVLKIVILKESVLAFCFFQFGRFQFEIVEIISSFFFVVLQLMLGEFLVYSNRSLIRKKGSYVFRLKDLSDGFTFYFFKKGILEFSQISMISVLSLVLRLLIFKLVV